MCVLVINYATSGTAPLLGSAGAAARAPHACVMTHATSAARPDTARKCVRSLSFVFFKFQNRRYERLTLVISANHYCTVLVCLGFANPDIRYPDIRIYPLILWQPKIRIS